MEKTENRIGQNFTVTSLALFALPSFFTNLFAQIFKSLDDGLFVSRFVGETALASLNLLNPLACIRMGLEHLFSLGASNISAKLMGEGKQLEAKQVFTRICISGVVVSGICAILLNIFYHPVLVFLGASEEHIAYAIYQIRIVYLIEPICLLNRTFNCYFSTAGKPKVGMYCSVINGVVNIGLDILLVAVLKMGVLGASIATAMGEVVVFFVGIFFFMNKKNEIYFVAPEGNYVPTTLESAKYSFPQFLNSVSFSVTAYISNIMILKMIGSTGVAANAVVSDVRSIINSGLIGFAICMGPIVSYNAGTKDTVKLKRILTYILEIWFVGSILLMGVGLLLRNPLISVFTSENSTQEFYDIAYYALTIELFATTFISGNITGNRMFIALGNSKAAIASSIFRNLIIKSIMYLALPMLFGPNGIWFAVLISEGIAFVFCSYLLYINADNYGYGKSGVAYRINN